MKELDLEMIEKAINGSVDAYTGIVNKYSNLIFAIVLSKTRDFYQAEDLAQEVFVKAWFKLPELKEPEKFLNWLIVLTKNISVDWIRSHSRKIEQIIQPKVLETVPSYNNDMNQIDLKTSVWKAINDLDEKYRIVTIMYHISGYKAKEISNLLIISLSAVESRLRRAKEKLKEELLDSMKETVGEKKLGKEFEDEVLWRIVPRISTIEIPVSNIQTSVDWYSKVLGTKVVYEDGKSAMLHLQGGNSVGVPTLYLVQTKDTNRLTFLNTETNITHSVIDFYFPHLERFHEFLKKEGTDVTQIKYIPNMPGFGGFGFKDPDGNLLSVCNVAHSGQE